MIQASIQKYPKVNSFFGLLSTSHTARVVTWTQPTWGVGMTQFGWKCLWEDHFDIFPVFKSFSRLVGTFYDILALFPQESLSSDEFLSGFLNHPSSFFFFFFNFRDVVIRIPWWTAGAMAEPHKLHPTAWSHTNQHSAVSSLLKQKRTDKGGYWLDGDQDSNAFNLFFRWSRTRRNFKHQIRWWLHVWRRRCRGGRRQRTHPDKHRGKITGWFSCFLSRHIDLWMVIHFELTKKSWWPKRPVENPNRKSSDAVY